MSYDRANPVLGPPCAQARVLINALRKIESVGPRAQARERLRRTEGFDLTLNRAVPDFKDGVCFSAHPYAAGVDDGNAIFDRVMRHVRMPEKQYVGAS